MFDIISYELGKKGATGTISLEGDDYTFTDENTDGNIVISEGGE